MLLSPENYFRASFKKRCAPARSDVHCPYVLWNIIPFSEALVTRPQRSIPAALTLFFVAPLVAEYLLGDLPLSLLSALIMLAPMYGGGALLIRELARRSGRGWPTILLLGAAYTFVEEGFCTQSLFNPNYLGFHLLAPAWIPSLGIGAWWTLFMLNLHPFWSIGVSIALVEGLFPARAHSPWLGKAATSFVAVFFAAGAAAGASFSFHQGHYMASVAQFLSVGLLAALLAAVAFLLPAARAQAATGGVPSAWLTGSAAFILGMALLFTPPGWKWGAFAAMLALDLLFLSVTWLLSRRNGWTALHTLSLGAGGALAYGVHAFFGETVVNSPRWLVRASNAVMLAFALALIAAGALRTRKSIVAATK
jgi:hypothetical protein